MLPVEPVETPRSQFLSELRATFLHWEQLRVVYNLVLVALTCTLVFGFRPEISGDPGFWAGAMLAAVAANVCFFLGPIADCYIRWLGYRSRVVTYGVFGVGMAFASLVTLVAAMLTINPNT
jgi:hypothetical protein